MGAVFEQRVADDATARLHAPGVSQQLQDHAQEITGALQSGAGTHVADAAPPEGRQALTEVAQWATAHGTNSMLITSAVLATVLAALTVLMTVGKGRTAPVKDEIVAGQHAPAAPAGATGTPPAVTAPAAR
jgi:hypothetical protein